MTEQKLNKLNALLRKRDDLISLQTLAGRELEWKDETAESDKPEPTGESCRTFIRVAIGNACQGVITDETYRKMWLLIEGDINSAAVAAQKAFELA